MRPEKILCIGTTFVLGGLELRPMPMHRGLLRPQKLYSWRGTAICSKAHSSRNSSWNSRGGRVKPESQALYCGDVRKRHQKKPAVRELERDPPRLKGARHRRLFVGPTPIGWSPEQAVFWSHDPCTRYPVVVIFPVSPVPRGPEITIAGTKGLLVHGQFRRVNEIGARTNLLAIESWLLVNLGARG
jgi:hypothetical protein